MNGALPPAMSTAPVAIRVVVTTMKVARCRAARRGSASSDFAVPRASTRSRAASAAVVRIVMTGLLPIAPKRLTGRRAVGCAHVSAMRSRILDPSAGGAERLVSHQRWDKLLNDRGRSAGCGGRCPIPWRSPLGSPRLTGRGACPESPVESGVVDCDRRCSAQRPGWPRAPRALAAKLEGSQPPTRSGQCRSPVAATSSSASSARVARSASPRARRAARPRRCHRADQDRGPRRGRSRARGA